MGAVEKSLVASEPRVSAGDEPRILCIIQDTVHDRKLTVNLPMSTTCDQLVTDVAQRINVPSNAIELVYELPKSENDDPKQITVNILGNKTIGELCADGGHRNSFCVCLKDGCAEKFDAAEGPSNVLCQATVTPVGCDNKDVYNSDNVTSTVSNTSSYSYASAVMKSDTGYVGLVNQAMTCYLNSLLQTLYMTPEFRNAVYRWEYDGSDGEAVKNIPYQLQRLFLQLQTSSKRAVETTDITRSFGWDSSEAWQQHDVQELCRVMFDALERSWKYTDQANLITQLYQGKIKDYVKCLKCGSESARTDAYLDIPLVVRPFGSNIGYESVEAALRAFVEPEILDGTNQYNCEKCGCKCDAHKGLKFLTFPYLLTLQLKRFDFDYSTMHRIKLNDRMSFPERLNLSQFIDRENEKDGSLAKESVNAGGCSALKDCPVSEKKECGDSGATSSPIVTSNSDEAIDEGIDLGDTASGHCASNNLARSTSDFSDAGRHHQHESDDQLVYELFSIMVHSGGASGGHYYVYIKSFKDGQWYSFNDQHVYRIMQDDIEKTFGGSSYSNSYYSSYSSSANAYMLMYRQCDPVRNKDFMQQSDFPPHLQLEVTKLKMRDEEEQQMRELERSMCKIKLYYYDSDTQRYIESKFEVHKNKTLAQATEMAWKQLRLPNVSLSDFRLVKFDSVHEYIERSFDDDETATMNTILGGVKSTYTFDLLADTKHPNVEFIPYNLGDVMIHVYPVDLCAEEILPPVTLRICPMRTVGDLKEMIARCLRLPTPDVRCVVERYYNQLWPLDNRNRTLQTESFQKTNKVFIETAADETDCAVSFVRSRLFLLLDRHQHTIRITVNVPAMPPSVKKTYHSGFSDEHAGNGTDGRTNDMDEGIGESEADIMSATDAESSCPATEQVASFAVDSSSSKALENSPNSDLRLCTPTPDKPFVDMTDASSHGLFVDTSVNDGAQAEEMSCDSFDVTAVGDCEQTPQMSYELNSPMYVGSASASLSQDSGSSQTVEVGDDVHSPSPSLDEFDRRSSIPDSRSPSPHGSSHSDDVLQSVLQSGIVPNAVDVDAAKDVASTKESDENWDQNVEMTPDDESTRNVYCFVEPTVFPLGCERVLFVQVDRRISLKALKAALEPHVGTTSDNFKVYKISQSGQEIEETRLSDTLVNYPNHAQINIKYGRALKPGEHRVQIYQLVLTDPEPMKYMVEVILGKDMTVLEAKQVIADELRSQHLLTVDVNRIRLRRKYWKSPSHIYRDDSAVLEDSVTNTLNPELLFEVLNGEDIMQSDGLGVSPCFSLYIRRWWPSKYQIDPFQEIFIDDLVLENTLRRISDVSGISIDNICYAKPKGTFPHDISVIEVEKDLEWNPNVSMISQWPLSISDDGAVIFYKDRTEELMDLSDEQKKQLQQKENSRLMKHGGGSFSYSHKKERALKIYTAEQPSVVSKSRSSDSSVNSLPTVSDQLALD